MRVIAVLLATVTFSLSSPAKSEEQPNPETVNLSQEQKEYLSWAKGIWESLERKQGEIKLANNVATLNVPEQFYYLNPTDAEKVLVEVWGNPPGSKTLGMLFPAEMTPFDDGSWAVTIEYEEDGYVSDKDVDEINYEKLLTQMQEATREASRQRVAAGYDTMELVGWAAKPFYDKDDHKLHWAKELQFGTSDINTLNYNIRVLGRKGVLLLNFIAGIDQKEVVQTKVDSVLNMANFDEGYRYEDFNPEVDKVAAYGIGALVAGKMLAKTGFLAAALVFMKKFGIFILIAFGALLAKFFRRKPAEAA